MPEDTLKLPTDIPWRLIDSSQDMMDVTFCDGKFPPPFRSSIALYAWQPKPEELPPDYCGDRITYLKVSCSISGFQLSEGDDDRLVTLLESEQIDPLALDAYLACYGVLLNVAVHPFDETLAVSKADRGRARSDKLDRYPRIIDFEPKQRDFVQAATETGEILTTSIGKLATGKSFGSIESMENSWKAGTEISIPNPTDGSGGDKGIGKITGETGQNRKDSGEANWSIDADASIDIKEKQSTVTQLSQLYSLLTGYHAGSNRATFVLLPRPHVLQPTDRRTFVNGLRAIEGIQDFFLAVARPGDQENLKVEMHLQTGHFPEDVEIAPATEDEAFERISYVFEPDTVTLKGKQAILPEAPLTRDFSRSYEVVLPGWEADPFAGEPGRGGVRELPRGTQTVTRVDFETGRVTGSYQVEVEPDEASNVTYHIEGNRLVVTFTLSADATFPLFGYKFASFDRAYEIFLRRRRINQPAEIADTSELLVTRRSLCTQIAFDPCARKIPLPRNLQDILDLGIVVSETPFDITDLFGLPSAFQPDINVDDVRSRLRVRSDFGFKRSILRKLHRAMVSSGSPREQHVSKTIAGSRTFRKLLLRSLAKETLARPAIEWDPIRPTIPKNLPAQMTLGELLGASERDLAARLKVGRVQARKILAELFGREVNEGK